MSEDQLSRQLLRDKIAAVVQELLDLLDLIDGDPDLEGEPDEPSLGSVGGTAADPASDQRQWAQGLSDHREDEHDGREPEEGW